MFRSNAESSVRFRHGMQRREFLQTGALSMLSVGLHDTLRFKAPAAINAPTNKSCIFLMLNGGPSQLDLWDMKPDAPSEIRGPYQPIKTNVPGIEISEILPRMAKQADKFALIRSVYHTAEATHDAGAQLMQTGRLSQYGVQHPHIGHVVASSQASREEIPSHVSLSLSLKCSEREMLPGQSAKLREAFNLRTESEQTKACYGRNRFGMNCLLARRMVERGTRFVTINMFDAFHHEVTWDIHGARPFSPMKCYENVVAPMFDMAYSSLLEDLHQRGLLNDTLVVATGEFGRTPHINPVGGRDHWPHCWTMLMAGGGVKGGQVIGASDEIAAYPKDRPVNPAEVAATIYHSLGIELNHEFLDEQGQAIRLVERGAQPIHELF